MESMNMSRESLEPRRESPEPCQNTTRNSPGLLAELWDLIRILGKACWQRFLLKMKESLKNLYCLPLMKERLPVAVDLDSLARISQTQDWTTTAFRYMDFHPSSPSLLMALVTGQDTVQLYDESFEMRSCLKDLEQRHITCVAFRPWSQELAVGCAAGVCLWKSNRRSKVYSQIRHMQGTHHMRMLQDEGHTCVTSLQWNEDGTILASAALSSAHIVLWEPDYQQKIRLIPDPTGLSSFALLRYRPDFQELLCARTNGGAIICKLTRSKWSKEQFHLQGRIQTAVWTTCSSHLLFVKENSTRLYSRTQDEEPMKLQNPKHTWHIEMVANLQEVSCSGEWRYCGEPLAIVMDPLGIYLAVIFKHQSFVLLCLLSPARRGPPRPIPMKFIECDGEEESEDEVYPSCMGFGTPLAYDPNTRFLVICWSSKHIQSYSITSQSFEEAQRTQYMNQCA